jgi:hypothetical protein
MKHKFYGYGIIGKSGKPYWDESCVCEDKAPMGETVACLNDDDFSTGPDDRPFRVVRLFYVTRGKR